MAYTEVSGNRVPIRMWTDPNTVEPQAMAQLYNVTKLPWIHGLAVMPDVHYGKGATVGSVIAMRDAVSPAAVGVDIGCGMTAVSTSLRAEDLPDDLRRLRSGHRGSDACGPRLAPHPGGSAPRCPRCAAATGTSSGTVSTRSPTRVQRLRERAAAPARHARRRQPLHRGLP